MSKEDRFMVQLQSCLLLSRTFCCTQKRSWRSQVDQHNKKNLLLLSYYFWTSRRRTLVSVLWLCGFLSGKFWPKKWHDLECISVSSDDNPPRLTWDCWLLRRKSNLLKAHTIWVSPGLSVHLRPKNRLLTVLKEQNSFLPSAAFSAFIELSCWAPTVTHSSTLHQVTNVEKHHKGQNHHSASPRTHLRFQKFGEKRW